MRVVALWFITLISLLGLFIPSFTLAQTTVQAPQSNFNPVDSAVFGDVRNNLIGGNAQTRDLRFVVFEIIRFALLAVGTVVLVLALYSGFLWFTAEGNSDQVETAKATIRNLVIGWFVIALSYTLVSFVFRSIFVPGQKPVDSQSQSWGDALTSPSFWNRQINPFAK